MFLHHYSLELKYQEVNHSGLQFRCVPLVIPVESSLLCNSNWKLAPWSTKDLLDTK